ncbi:hypothetical protein LCGC14_1909150 [marine sediment metagenome]|uniref:Uncharacterized protein n=1 Tax=marine sediment metagenome TaxID=412755 RepID=A0A0F9GHF9_9ZZZZ
MSLIEAYHYLAEDIPLVDKDSTKGLKEPLCDWPSNQFIMSLSEKLDGVERREGTEMTIQTETLKILLEEIIMLRAGDESYCECK